MRKPFLHITVLATMGMSLSGCITASGNALTRDVVSKLPPLEVRFQSPYTCAQLVDALGADDPLSASQLRTAYRICEESQKGMLLEPSKAAGAFPGFNGVSGLPF